MVLRPAIKKVVSLPELSADVLESEAEVVLKALPFVYGRKVREHELDSVFMALGHESEEEGVELSAVQMATLKARQVLPAKKPDPVVGDGPKYRC